MSDAAGRLDPVPVVGGFEGNRGEFYAEDRDNDRTRETNWTADFTRAGAAEVCDGGRPKR